MQEPLARRVLPRVDWREIAAIFAGGALGTLARAALNVAASLAAGVAAAALG